LCAVRAWRWCPGAESASIRFPIRSDARRHRALAGAPTDRRRLRGAADRGSRRDRVGRCAAGRASRERSVTAQLLREHAKNDLLAAAERLCPEIAEARSRAAAAGIQLALSGSGPTLFAVAEDRRDALRMRGSFAGSALWHTRTRWLVRVAGPGERGLSP
jgi:4-diphosphocytidyl-2-C-methyl-D-erythritol kinase